MNEAEWINESGILKRFEAAEAGGVHLTTAQKAFIMDAARETWRKVKEQKTPRRMTPAQRSMKADLIGQWRAGLEGLRMFEEAYGFGHYGSVGKSAWFRPKDAEKVFDQNAVLRVIGTCLTFYGKEFADAVLDTVKDVYTQAGEDILIVRGLQPWGGLPELRRSFASR